MTAVADQLDGWRRRQFRRLLLVSAALHIGGMLLLGFSPTTSHRPAAADVIAVEVVMAPRAAAPARPAPAPAPKPQPVPSAPPAPVPPPVPVAPPAPEPPPAPVKKQVVLPKQPEVPKPKPPEPKPELKPELKPEPKPEAKPEPKPQRRELDPSEYKPQQAQVEDYEDVMAKLRAEADEPSAEPAPTPPATPQPVQVASAAASDAGSGRPVDPELAAWMKRARIHVRSSWAVPGGFRMQPLETRVMVRLDGAGNVLGEPEILRRSGNPWYDDGVVRGIQKASPLPPPPEAGEWEFIFVPEEY